MKPSHEKDDHEVTKLSYNKLFKLSAKSIEENDNIKKHNLDFKDYLEFLEKSNKMLKHETTNIRNSTGTCETSVSMKNEVKYLHDTLGKFTKENKTLT